MAANFQPGHSKVGGRKKGTPNRLTRDVRELILGALDAEGGLEYLRSQARENPTAFLTLVGKCLPREASHAVSGVGGAPIVLTWADPEPR
jgi:hypothetical protein